jgi:hypothetical protein
MMVSSREIEMTLKKLNALTLDEYRDVIKSLFACSGYYNVSNYYPNGNVHHDKIYIHAGLPVICFEESATAISVIIQAFQGDVAVSDVVPLIEYVENDGIPSELGMIVTTGYFMQDVCDYVVFTPHKHRYMLMYGGNLAKAILNKHIKLEDFALRE